MQISYLRYAGVYVLTVVALMAIAWAMATFLGMSFPMGAGSVIPVMIAALVEGQAQGKALRNVPDRKALWGAAIMATVIVFAINGLILLLLMQQPEIASVLRSAPVNWMAGFAAIMVAVVLGLNWWFLGVGAKAGAKAGS